MIHIICLVSFGACLFYTLFAYMSTYLIQYGTLSFQKITSIQTLLIVSMLILVPLFSLLCDKIGRRHMYFIFCSLGIISSYPAFIIFQGGVLILIISMLSWLTLISSMEQATTLITLVEITPPEIRYTILALASNIGYILFGGLTPLVLSGAIHLTHNHLMPAFYLMATACLSLLSSSLLKKRI
jgi:MFS transporter, MHS family, proline/betaine transporter